MIKFSICILLNFYSAFTVLGYSFFLSIEIEVLRFIKEILTKLFFQFIILKTFKIYPKKG